MPINAEFYVLFYIQISKTALAISDTEIKCECTNENFQLTEQAIVLIPAVKEHCFYIIIIIIIIIIIVSCHRPFLRGTSVEPAVIPTAQVSSFTLQYFPYYV